MILLII